MTSRPSIEPVGDSALRMQLPVGVDSRAVLSALRALARVRDVVVTEQYVCVYFDPDDPPDEPTGVLASLGGIVAPEPRRLSVRVRYDGPDLGKVATFAGLDVHQVIELHQRREYTVTVVGFLPGFAYLAEVDPRIAAPRLAAPRPRIPAGAVGVAGSRTGIYPFPSPGGWNLIGTAVDFVPFDPQHGARLSVGDRVRFESVS